MPDASSTIALASAIAVASVAGFISVFNLLVTKDQKISEYRQQWLEDVRSDIASLVSQAQLLFGHMHLLHASSFDLGNNTPIAVTPENHAEYIEKTLPIYDEINRCSVRLELRLNGAKHEHKAVLLQLKTLQNLLGDIDVFRAKIIKAGYDQALDEVNTAADLLVEAASELIKSTWERVKAGEPAYRKGKWLILGFTVLFALILGGAIWLNLRTSPPSDVKANRVGAKTSIQDQTPSPNAHAQSEKP